MVRQNVAGDLGIFVANDLQLPVDLAGIGSRRTGHTTLIAPLVHVGGIGLSRGLFHRNGDLAVVGQDVLGNAASDVAIHIGAVVAESQVAGLVGVGGVGPGSGSSSR